jgi:hypothetical protein
MNVTTNVGSCVCARTPLYPQRCALTPEGVSGAV